jgi:triosephosphate isomerase (TIM)
MFFSKPMIRKGLNPNKPFIILNFKTYKESSSNEALRLADIASRVQSRTGLNIIICPQTIDIKEVASSVIIPVFAQHIDIVEAGKSTGSIVAENLLGVNVHGSILNHSERRLEYKTLQKTVLKLKELDMKSIVCAKDDKEAKRISMMKPVKPDFISVEPPELIGGERSVSTAKPEIIKRTVAACQGIPVIVGAGIKDNNDLKTALSLGAKGVLLSSHYVLSENPEEFLMKLVEGTY